LLVGAKLEHHQSFQYKYYTAKKGVRKPPVDSLKSVLTLWI
jgi:hypothetical protein